LKRPSVSPSFSLSPDVNAGLGISVFLTIFATPLVELRQLSPNILDGGSRIQWAKYLKLLPYCSCELFGITFDMHITQPCSFRCNSKPN